jgi:uncharacterized protein YeeX (DUF496 family)
MDDTTVMEPQPTPVLEVKTLEDRISERWKLKPEAVPQFADFVRSEVRDGTLELINTNSELQRQLEIAQSDLAQAKQALEYERQRTDDYVIKAAEAKKELEDKAEEYSKMRERNMQLPLDEIETLMMPAAAVTKGEFLRASGRVNAWLQNCRAEHAAAADMPMMTYAEGASEDD